MPAGTMQLLSSAARTATVDIKNQQTTGNGAIFYLRVTAASGTGGLVFKIMWEDFGGNFHQINLDPPTVTAIGTYIYVLYPSTLSATLVPGVGNTKQVTIAPISNPFGVRISHLNASSYTYSVDVSFVQ